MTTTITSKDGTTLVTDTNGTGAPVILIGGAFNDRSTIAALGAELASQFTVVTYDRRGRGASDDHSDDYRVANEVDDLAAVIAQVAGRASVFGHSSGAVLALECVMHTLPIDKVAVYEPSYSADESLSRPTAEVYDRIKALVTAGDSNGAAALFLSELIGVPASVVAEMKAGPAWPFLADKGDRSDPGEIIYPSARCPSASRVTAPWSTTRRRLRRQSEHVQVLGVRPPGPTLAVGDSQPSGLQGAQSPHSAGHRQAGVLGDTGRGDVADASAGVVPHPCVVRRTVAGQDHGGERYPLFWVG